MIYIILKDNIANDTFFYEISIPKVGSKFIRLTDADCAAHRCSLSDTIYKIAIEYAEEKNFNYEGVIYV